MMQSGLYADGIMEREMTRNAAQAYFKVVRSVPYALLTICATILIILERLALNVSGCFLEAGIVGTILCAALRISAVSGILTVFCMWAAPAAMGVCWLSLTCCRWLIRIKECAWYAIGASLVIGYVDAMQVAGSAEMKNTIIITVFGVIVVVAAFMYALVLRNASTIAGDMAKTIRTGAYQHSFGHSCGLTKQSVSLVVFSVLLFFLLEFFAIVFISFIPAVAKKYLGTLYPLWQMYMPVLLVVATIKFILVPILYVKYMRASISGQGSAVDKIISNTPEDATPIQNPKY